MKKGIIRPAQKDGDQSPDGSLLDGEHLASYKQHEIVSIHRRFIKNTVKITPEMRKKKKA